METYNKKTFIRTETPLYSIPKNCFNLTDDNAVGWFRNAYNPAGWHIFPLDTYTDEWLKNHDINTSNVFRILSDDGNSCIVRININTCRVLWFNNQYYEDTDIPAFECYWTQYNCLIMDDTSAFAV